MLCWIFFLGGLLIMNDPSCCENGGHLWDMAAMYPPGEKWGASAPAFDDGPVYRIAPSLQQKMSPAQQAFARPRQVRVSP